MHALRLKEEKTLRLPKAAEKVNNGANSTHYLAETTANWSSKQYDC